MTTSTKRNQNLTRLIIIFVKFAPVFGAIAGLVIGAIFVIAWGASPWLFITELAKGAFGDFGKIGATLNRTTPLLIAGAGTAIAFKAGAFNVGQEGQLHIGAIGAVLTGFAVGILPRAIALPLVFIGSMIGGIVLASIAVLLYLKRGVHEVLSTLLLNFIGTYFTAYMVSGPIRDTSGLNIGHPQTALMPMSLRLPIARELGFTHFGIIIGLVIVLAAHYLINHTPLGFKITMVGLSPDAARTAGIRPERIFALGMFISGALSGLAGAVEITGIFYRLLYGFGEGLGFDALAVALLAGSSPLAVIPSALFFGALRAGSMSMQRGIGIPSVVLHVIRGAIIIFVLIGFALRKNKKIQKILTAYEKAKVNAQLLSKAGLTEKESQNA